MKKILILLVSLIVTLSLFACEKACTDQNGDGKCDDCGVAMPGSTPEEPEEPEEPAADELKLIENGEANFVLVVQKSATSSIVKAVDNLIKDLKKFDVEVEKIFDEANNAVDCEVLIGVPENRGDKYKYDMHALGEEGYLIKLIDGKIMIVGGSETALIEAIETFKEDFIGIKKSTKELTNVVVKSSQNVEKIQDGYRITALKHNGNDMKGFTISYTENNKYALDAAEYIQQIIYSKTGYWFETVENSEPESGISVQILENTYEGNGFYTKITDELISFECEFPDRLLTAIESYFAKNVSVAQGDIDFTAKTHNYTENIRAIYYSEFGATDNGEVDDDFKAISEAHKYANLWGHDVYADKGATYYFGQGYQSSIPIKTNTYWGDAVIIIDDSELLPEANNGYKNNIFSITSDYKVLTYSESANNLPITTITKDATNIGFAPGYKAMIKVYNSNHKNYIRYGGNADNGQSQVEVVLVDENGNILDDTNLMWDYETVTSLYVYRVDDRPITVSGGNIEIYYNQAPSEYTYYGRGMLHHRSNVTITGLHHNITGEGDHGAPLSGFVVSQNNYNSKIDNCHFDEPKNFYTIGSGNERVVMGSYAFTGTACINLTWSNLTLETFYRTEEQGDTQYAASGGQMGSNHCKNIYFINNELSSFDAHCGAQNVTIIGCRLEHINCIGEGTIHIEDTTVFAQYQGVAVNLRSDYGSIWMGDAIFKNVELRVLDRTKVALFNASWVNHYFGYTACMPHTVTLDNVYATSDHGLKINTIYLTLSDLTAKGDISADILPDGTKNLNPYNVTQKIIVKNNVKNMKISCYDNLAPYHKTEIIYEDD